MSLHPKIFPASVHLSTPLTVLVGHPPRRVGQYGKPASSWLDESSVNERCRSSARIYSGLTGSAPAGVLHLQLTCQGPGKTWGRRVAHHITRLPPLPRGEPRRSRRVGTPGEARKESPMSPSNQSTTANVGVDCWLQVARHRGLLRGRFRIFLCSFPHSWVCSPGPLSGGNTQTHLALLHLGWFTLLPHLELSCYVLQKAPFPFVRSVSVSQDT